MKLVLVGAAGTLGKAIAEEFGGTHDIIKVGRRSGDYQADMRDSAAVVNLFRAVGNVDAIVAAAGEPYFGPLYEMTAEQFSAGLNDKLVGQVRLALLGEHYLTDGGSLTLTSGIIGEEPMRYGANAASVNAALEGFVRAAAIELPRGIRINAVSPSVVIESWRSYARFFPGYEPVPSRRVALAFRRSVSGSQTGSVYRVW